MLGFSLSLPNILFQIYRKFIKQRICPAFILANDIIYHFALGNLLSYPLHMGGNNSLWIGGVSIVLYVSLSTLRPWTFLYQNFLKFRNYDIPIISR